MAGIPVHRTPIRPEWIDYNGHLRDAFYTLIASEACDALMDRLGMDEAYRRRTACTLYTLELHVHYLSEVKGTDEVGVNVRILGADAKRLHADFEIVRARDAGVAATVEAMLLHVRQSGAAAGTTPFPPEVAAAIAALERQTAGLPASSAGSRQMALRRPPSPA